MIFFDENNAFTQLERYVNLKKLNTQIDFYTENIRQTKEELYELRTNNFTKEKFAREHYYMKRDNEEVFVFIPNRSAPKKEKSWWQKWF